MTRVKKKIRSVAGQKFVPIKQEPKKTKNFDDPDSYESRKKRALAKRKRHASVYAKSQAETEADTKQAKRRTRLKHDPALVAQKSRELMEKESTEADDDQN